MRKLGRTFVTVFALAAMFAMAVPGAANAKAPVKGEGRNMEIVANINYPGGTDMEFATIKGHDYFFTGSAPGVGGAKAGAFRVINVDNPEKPKVVAQLDCSLYQADIQLSFDHKTAIIAADSAGGPDSCLALGKLGFMTIDIRNPKKPKPLGFAQINRGSHNTTAHPKAPYVYNSDSDLAQRGNIEVWSIKNPAKPEHVNDLVVAPHSPHDISFSKDGKLAVTAAVSHLDMIDTSDPENPSLLSVNQCPGCSITHDAKFTPDMEHVIVGDEGGGGLAYPCPGGALYFYDVVGGTALALTGVYEPDEVLLARDGQTEPGACTAHVFDISDDGTKVAISWYSAGTRYLDVSSAVGPTFGENTAAGVKDLGYFMPDGGVSWSSKFMHGKAAKGKTTYIFSNDEHRGFDVFKVVEDK